MVHQLTNRWRELRDSFGGERSPGHAYQLEAANSLGDWSIIATNLAGPEGALEFLDPDTAGRATRFYRVLAP